MHVFLWGLISADRLSTNEHLHLKGYTTEFLYGGKKKHLMILNQESHGLYPADSDIFRVDKYKTRFI